jgi:hypothetical protein
MIMPETHRENRHRGDTAQRKSCQTVQKADINNNSLPDRKFANQKSREFPALRLFLVFQLVASRCEGLSLNGAGTKMLWRCRNPRRRSKD